MNSREFYAPGARADVDDHPRMRLIGFKPIGKAGLAGFATVELGIGLRITDIPVFLTGQSGPWAGLPRRPILDRERRQRIGADGKPSFEPVVEWRDRETSDRFSAAVVELIRAAHPEAFEDRAA
jgi:hypothetical protein